MLHNLDIEQKALLENLGERIRKSRLTRGLKQAELAGICGFDKASMNRIEQGKVNISYYTLNKICQNLGITLKDFFVEPDTATAPRELWSGGLIRG